MMWTEDLIMRSDGPAKFDIKIKSDWLLMCFTFVKKLPDKVMSAPELKLFNDTIFVILYMLLKLYN